MNTIEYWHESLNINLRPHFFSIQKAVEQMQEGGSGSIGWMRVLPDVALYNNSNRIHRFKVCPYAL